MRISPHASVLVYVEGPRVLCRTIDNALSRAVPVACNTLLSTLEFIKAWFASTASIILDEILAKRLILIIFRSFRVSPNGIRSMQNIHSQNQRQAVEAGVMATRR
jgi:hypothetical protein